MPACRSEPPTKLSSYFPPPDPERGRGSPSPAPGAGRAPRPPARRPRGPSERAQAGGDGSGSASRHGRSSGPAVPFGHGQNSCFHLPKKEPGAGRDLVRKAGAGSAGAGWALKLQRSKALRIHRAQTPPCSLPKESSRFKILLAFNTTEEKLRLTNTESSDERFFFF